MYDDEGLARYFTSTWEQVTGNTFHPWADIITIIGLLDGTRTTHHARCSRSNRRRARPRRARPRTRVGANTERAPSGDQNTLDHPHNRTHSRRSARIAMAALIW